MARRRKYDDLVEEFFEEKMSPRIKKLVAAAIWDVHNGPLSAEEALDRFSVRWRGYSEAIDELRDWWAEKGGEVWVDMQAEYIIDVDPELSSDGDLVLEDFMHYSDRDAKRAVFGVLVTDGAM